MTVGEAAEMAGKSPEMPASEWLTYSAGAERLGVSPNSIALREARRPMRKRSENGEMEIEVPGTLLVLHTELRVTAAGVVPSTPW